VHRAQAVHDRRAHRERIAEHALDHDQDPHEATSVGPPVTRPHSLSGLLPPVAIGQDKTASAAQQFSGLVVSFLHRVPPPDPHQPIESNHIDPSTRVCCRSVDGSSYGVTQHATPHRDPVRRHPRCREPATPLIVIEKSHRSVTCQPLSRSPGPPQGGCSLHPPGLQGLARSKVSVKPLESARRQQTIWPGNCWYSTVSGPHSGSGEKPARLVPRIACPA
jgi:hypothetical protein